MNKGIFAIMFAIMIFAAMVPFAAAEPVGVEDVVLKIDGDITVDATQEDIRTNKQRGETLEVKTIFLATRNMEDFQVEVEIFGDDHHEIREVTDTFDAEQGVRYIKTLDLELPDIMDRDDYKLRVTFSDRYSEAVHYEFNLKVSTPEDQVVIKDVIFTPEEYVMAGRALIGTVKVRNMGTDLEEDVKVRVKIPGLGISGSDYIDEIEPDESKETEEIYLRVPDCVEDGMYEVNVEVEFDDGFEEVEKTFEIEVRSDHAICSMQEEESTEEQEKAILMIGNPEQSVERGKGGAVYPITISNTGNSRKAYTIEVSGAQSWAITSVSPTNVIVLESGKEETAYLYVSAKEEASLGEHQFSVKIKEGDETLKEITLKSVVVEPVKERNVWKTVLEIALIVLVLILIVLAAIIGYRKVKENKEDEDEEISGQTYY